MADKSVITNIEARVRQLIDDHKRLSDLCTELTAQRDTLRSEKRTLEERVRELDAELARMQLTEGLAGGGRNREKARARVNRLMREVDKCIAAGPAAGGPDDAGGRINGPGKNGRKAGEEDDGINETKKWQNRQ